MVARFVHALRQHMAVEVVKAQLVLFRVKQPAPKHFVPVLVRQVRVAKRAGPVWAVVVYAVKPV